MSNATTLIDHPIWKKLLISAENSIGKNASFYEAPEPQLFEQLMRDFEGDNNDLVEEVLEMLKTVSKNEPAEPKDWAILKEGATLLYHLQEIGFTPDPDWESAVNALWFVAGEFGQGSWSEFWEASGDESIPLVWKQKKFVLDALLQTLIRINHDDEDRIERFFNCNLSDYWKAYFLYNKEIWGGFQEDREAYFKSRLYRNNHKLTTYRLLSYRLERFDTEFEAHPHKYKEAFEFLLEYNEQIPSESSVRKQLYEALFRFLPESGTRTGMQKCLETITTILTADDAFAYLLEPDSPPSGERGKLMLFFDDLEDRWNTSKTNQHNILRNLLKSLKHDEMMVRENAAKFLEPHEDGLFKYLRYMENSKEPQAGVETFKLIRRVYKERIILLLLENISFTPKEKGKFLLQIPRLLEATWDSQSRPNHKDLLPVLLAVVQYGNEPYRTEASKFLKRKSAAIKQQLDDLIKAVGQNEEQASEMMANAVEFGSEAALKTILQQCILWVASNQYGPMVDRAAQKARQNSAAVSALINLLNNRQDIAKNEDVKKHVRLQVLEDQEDPVIQRVFHDGKLTKDEYNQHTIESLYKWCYAQRERSKVYGDLIGIQEENMRKSDGELKPEVVFELADSILSQLQKDELEERDIAVQKWITEILSEMSDDWYFEDNREAYEEIKKQLERLAIEPLSKRLPLEENVDIRENLVKILGNIGGRVAVDALVRTVTGEERERDARQELLSEYYLKPSKARSEEASILLNEAVDNAKKTMRLLQSLNTATFAIGVILILGGVSISIISDELGGRVTGALTGLGGLAAIITQFLKDPLERIQRAMADLVQVQTAFTSFVWELNLNSTYIQSQYVSEGKLTDFDLRQTIGRISQAMERTMHLIQVYADGDVTQKERRLMYSLVSEDGDGFIVTVFGTGIIKNETDKENMELAVNHTPVEAELQICTELYATFHVGGDVLAPAPGQKRIWLSLLVNGEETNSLPHIPEKEPSLVEDLTEKVGEVFKKE